MEKESALYLVDSRALPEVFIKVAQAKKLIAQNKVSSCSDAARTVGISRSAYYKYKDFIFPYENKIDGTIATYYISLCDEPGVLSEVISKMYRAGANILTINQNIPVEGVAPVVITFRTGKLNIPEAELRGVIAKCTGVSGIKILTGVAGT
ncbi:MAG: ACT domain-containing protein [Oscillospiraceae bacterium]|nr:ACT domain-containing protein [Oscillospiraceae bacterium]